MSFWPIALALVLASGGPEAAAEVPGGVAADVAGGVVAGATEHAAAMAGPDRVEAWPSSSPKPARPILGEDKLRHLGMAFAVTDVGFGVARLAVGTDDARATGVGLALVASVGKELYDRRRGGRIDPADLVWDLAGIALGAVLIHQIE